MIKDTHILVSVIVPVYNVESRLDRCIRSIVSQTYKNLQIILVDDGSKDRSGMICDEWASKDDRITVIHQPNSGVGAARNKGLDYANGTYVAFIDSDDYIDPESYSRLVQIAERDQADEVCYCIYNVTAYHKSEVKHVFENQVLRGEQIFSELVMAMVTPGQGGAKGSLLQSPCNKLYRLSVINDNHVRFHTDLSQSEDWLFNLNYYRFAQCVSFIPDYLYYYDITTDGSLSKKFLLNGFEIAFTIHSFEKDWFPQLYTEEAFRNYILTIQSNYLNRYVRTFGYSQFGTYARRLYDSDSLRGIYARADTIPVRYRLPHFCFVHNGAFYKWLYCAWATIHVSFTALKYYIKKMIGK